MPREPPSGLTVPPRQAMPMHFIVMLDTTITVIAAVTRATSFISRRVRWMRATVATLSLGVTQIM